MSRQNSSAALSNDTLCSEQKQKVDMRTKQMFLRSQQQHFMYITSSYIHTSEYARQYMIYSMPPFFHAPVHGHTDTQDYNTTPVP